MGWRKCLAVRVKEPNLFVFFKSLQEGALILVNKHQSLKGSLSRWRKVKVDPLVGN